MIFYMLLSFHTAVFLGFCACTDLKGRFIYSFPCRPLFIFWFAFGMAKNRPSLKSVLAFWGIHAGIWFLLHVKKIWGDGDSDLMMLFAAVFWTGGGNCRGNEFAGMSITGLELTVMELIALMLILLVSILLSIIEMKIRKQKWSLKTGAAMAPGFCLITAGLMIYGMTMYL